MVTVVCHKLYIQRQNTVNIRQLTNYKNQYNGNMSLPRRRAAYAKVCPIHLTYLVIESEHFEKNHIWK